MNIQLYVRIRPLFNRLSRFSTTTCHSTITDVPHSNLSVTLNSASASPAVQVHKSWFVWFALHKISRAALMLCFLRTFERIYIFPQSQSFTSTQQLLSQRLISPPLTIYISPQPSILVPVLQIPITFTTDSLHEPSDSLHLWSASEIYFRYQISHSILCE